MKENKDLWRRRLALQIVAQLPDKQDDAVAVLRAAEEIIRFVAEGGGGHGQQGEQERIVAFPAAVKVVPIGAVLGLAMFPSGVLATAGKVLLHPLSIGINWAFTVAELAHADDFFWGWI
jgi:hypothetical protein